MAKVELHQAGLGCQVVEAGGNSQWQWHCIGACVCATHRAGPLIPDSVRKGVYRDDSKNRCSGSAARPRHFGEERGRVLEADATSHALTRASLEPELPTGSDVVTDTTC